MSKSSILGGTKAPLQPDGTQVDRLGPSDTSDSGSDVQGERPMATAPDNPGEWGAVVADMNSDTDASGTGDRASADGDAPRDGADILPDHVVANTGAGDAGSNRRASIEAAELSTDASSADGSSTATAADPPTRKRPAMKPAASGSRP